MFFGRRKSEINRAIGRWKGEVWVIIKKGSVGRVQHCLRIIASNPWRPMGESLWKCRMQVDWGRYHIRGRQMERRATIGCRSRRLAPLLANPPEKRRRESELVFTKPGFNFQGKEVGKGYPPPPDVMLDNIPKISSWNSLSAYRQSRPLFGSFSADCQSR